MMIDLMSRDVEAMLRKREFPFRVVYGPERLKRSAGQTFIHFDRDRESGDGARAMISAQSHPRVRRIRDLGVVVTVYAQSTKASARYSEHEELCDALVDAIMFALDEWFTGAKTGALPEYTESRLLRGEELEAEYAQWPGVVYRLRFDLPRGVRELTFKGEARPTGSAAGVSGEVHVRREGGTEPAVIVPLPGGT